MTETDELHRVIGELTQARLLASDWAAIEAELVAVDAAGPADRDGAIHRLSQVVFEARIQQRFVGGRATSTLPPTKQTSALPWVGLVCAALLLAVGGALGGGEVFVAVALLGIFVFGIAMAGSRIAHRKVAPRPGDTADTPAPQPVAMPDDVRAAIVRVQSGL